MRLRLVAAVMALIVTFGADISHADDDGQQTQMSVDEAIGHLRTGDFDDCGDGCKDRVAQLVKQDIKACLTFYGPKDCTGPAKDWVTRWNSLRPLPNLAENSDASQSPILPPPSLLGWHAPFTKSAVDYFVEMSRPLAGATR